MAQIGDKDDGRSEIGSDSDLGPPPPLTTVPLIGSVRLRMTVMGLFGFFNMYAQRVNLSVALVAMVHQNSNNGTRDLNNTCPVDPNHHDFRLSSPFSSNNRSNIVVNNNNNVVIVGKPSGEFEHWDSFQQSVILGAFFYGYIITQIPGGILAQHIGGKLVYGIAGIITSIFTLLTPLSARLGWKCLVAIRIIIGLADGVRYPAMNSLFSAWSPPMERSRLSTIAFGGAQLGNIVTLPIGGLLCHYVRWDSVFYLTGLLGIIWAALWMYLISDTPSSCRFIKTDEKDFIESTLVRERGSLKEGSTPWFHIWTSPRVWALIIAHFCHSWSFELLITKMPSFLKNILHFDIKANGFLSALPYVFQWIMIITSGVFADYLRNNYLSTTMVRKLMSIAGFGMTVLSWIGLAYVGCNHVLAIIFLIGAAGFGGANFSGILCNHLDIAPQYAGILLGITNGIATIPGFTAPAVVGFINDPDPTIAGWQTVFMISAGVSLFGLITYLLLGNGDVQAWAKSPTNFSNPSSGGDVPEEQQLLARRPNVYSDTS